MKENYFHVLIGHFRTKFSVEQTVIWLENIRHAAIISDSAAVMWLASLAGYDVISIYFIFFIVYKLFGKTDFKHVNMDFSPEYNIVLSILYTLL